MNTLYYEIHGSGKPLVLIHGGGSTIVSNWAVIMPLLAKKYQIIAVELRGHGHTPDHEGPATFEQDADDVATVLDHIGIRCAAILGFSNGGNTAMQLAIRQPGKVERLMLASTFYKRSGMQSWFWPMMEGASLKTMPAPLKQAYLDVAPNKDDLIKMHDKDRDRMLCFTDWPDQALAGITAPTLIIVAGQDVMTLEHAIEMHRLIKGSGLVILPGSHGAYLGEVCTAIPGSRLPELTAILIEEFMEG
jgi:pimeloyl-ACP methyl ester carboxylesterase